MIKTITRVGLALSLLLSIAATTVQAGQSNDNKTVLTFTQPVEISGYVLPAGKYTFQLADSLTDRHMVLIFDANSNLVATVMAIPNYRFKTSDDAVVKFGDLPVGSPEVVRAWFYPGGSIGEEFVYPKPRAAELAKAAHAPVPAIAASATDTELLKTAPIVAITPTRRRFRSPPRFRRRRKRRLPFLPRFRASRRQLARLEACRLPRAPGHCRTPPARSH